jgi:hypothetical protein
MTFVEPKPGGWASEERLTSFQMTALQAAIVTMDGGLETEIAAAAAASTAGDAALQVQVTANLAALTLEQKRTLLAGMLLRSTDLGSAAPADTSAAIGVISTAQDDVLVVKGGTDGIFRFADLPLVNNSPASIAGITSNVRKIAQNGSGRYIAAGSGSNHNAFSTNNGLTWTSGGAVSAALEDIVWDGTQFVAWASDEVTSHSTNGVAWTAATIGSDTFNVLTGGTRNGLAVLAGGTVVGAGAITNPAFVKSTNHGLTWSNTGGTLPNASDMVAARGWLAGNGGSTIYYLGSPGGSTLRFFASSNASAWTLRSTLTGLTFASGTPKLLMCQDTGLLVALAPQSFGNVAVSVSRDLGFTWSAHHNVTAGPVHSLGVARGRLGMSLGAKLFASDGMGQ